MLKSSDIKNYKQFFIDLQNKFDTYKTPEGKTFPSFSKFLKSLAKKKGINGSDHESLLKELTQESGKKEFESFLNKKLSFYGEKKGKFIKRIFTDLDELVMQFKLEQNDSSKVVTSAEKRGYKKTLTDIEGLQTKFETDYLYEGSDIEALRNGVANKNGFKVEKGGIFLKKSTKKSTIYLLPEYSPADLEVEYTAQKDPIFLAYKEWRKNNPETSISKFKTLQTTNTGNHWVEDLFFVDAKNKNKATFSRFDSTGPKEIEPETRRRIADISLEILQAEQELGLSTLLPDVNFQGAKVQKVQIKANSKGEEFVVNNRCGSYAIRIKEELIENNCDVSALEKSKDPYGVKGVSAKHLVEDDLDIIFKHNPKYLKSKLDQLERKRKLQIEDPLEFYQMYPREINGLPDLIKEMAPTLMVETEAKILFGSSPSLLDMMSDEDKGLNSEIKEKERSWLKKIITEKGLEEYRKQNGGLVQSYLPKFLRAKEDSEESVLQDIMGKILLEAASLVIQRAQDDREKLKPKVFVPQKGEVSKFWQLVEVAAQADLLDPFSYGSPSQASNLFPAPNAAAEPAPVASNSVSTATNTQYIQTGNVHNDATISAIDRLNLAREKFWDKQTSGSSFLPGAAAGELSEDLVKAQLEMMNSDMEQLNAPFSHGSGKEERPIKKSSKPFDKLKSEINSRKEFHELSHAISDTVQGVQIGSEQYEATALMSFSGASFSGVLELNSQSGGPSYEFDLDIKSEFRGPHIVVSYNDPSKVIIFASSDNGDYDVKQGSSGYDIVAIGVNIENGSQGMQIRQSEVKALTQMAGDQHVGNVVDNGDGTYAVSIKNSPNPPIIFDSKGLFPTLSPTTASPTNTPTQTPTTVSPTTASPTNTPTQTPTTVSPTTASPTNTPTQTPTTVSPTTASPTNTPTQTPTTVSPTTASPTNTPTQTPTTVSPTTASPTNTPTQTPTTVSPTTASPTNTPTQTPTTVSPTTASPTNTPTQTPTTVSPTTASPTNTPTQTPTTVSPTTASPTNTPTQTPTTVSPTTASPTNTPTQTPTTVSPTTASPTNTPTQTPTTVSPTTASPTNTPTQTPTTVSPTTASPTNTPTQTPTTVSPTTASPTNTPTQTPTTVSPTTASPTNTPTQTPTTVSPTTASPTNTPTQTPTTVSPTTASPTNTPTQTPTTVSPTTASPTNTPTQTPTTVSPTTASPTNTPTQTPTTVSPTTASPTNTPTQTPTTVSPTTASPTNTPTQTPTTVSPTTASPTNTPTQTPTTVSPTTASPTNTPTQTPTTVSPTTASPTNTPTQTPTTVSPTTASPTNTPTQTPTTVSPTTASPTNTPTQTPTTVSPTTASPTNTPTQTPTTVSPTTASPTNTPTQTPTTVSPTTASPTNTPTQTPTTVSPTTASPTNTPTQTPTTVSPTTASPTNTPTQTPTTVSPTTASPTNTPTQTPTTVSPTTASPTNTPTQTPTTVSPTTASPTNTPTQTPTTVSPTTASPTNTPTQTPTTVSPTTASPTNTPTQTPTTVSPTTASPTNTPTQTPTTVSPTTASPTNTPTQTPTTVSPTTASPTNTPTQTPTTVSPTTASPTNTPTQTPTTVSPTTASPTNTPTQTPTTVSPTTASPTNTPTQTPTTVSPTTASPTNTPTQTPTTVSPTTASPTNTPTQTPTTVSPTTASPTNTPTQTPTTVSPTTASPTNTPTQTPTTVSPTTASPTNTPTQTPTTVSPTTASPTNTPTQTPTTVSPTTASPTNTPTQTPTTVSPTTASPTNTPTQTPTTVSPTTASPTNTPTQTPTTVSPTTASPTNTPTQTPTTVSPTTASPTNTPTQTPTTVSPTTASPTNTPTQTPTTVSPTTASPTNTPTQTPTTVSPTTASPTNTPTQTPTTVSPTTASPTNTPTQTPTTVSPTTASPTNTPTQTPTTVSPTTASPTNTPTQTPTTVSPTTASPTNTPTQTPTTVSPTTASPTNTPTQTPTTVSPTTASPTNTPTQTPTTVSPTTASPTNTPTQTPTTVSPTTASPTNTPTQTPTTVSPTTEPTTPAPTSKAPTASPTPEPTTGPTVKTSSPSAGPTVQTDSPTQAPTTPDPTAPTTQPTFAPTKNPINTTTAAALNIGPPMAESGDNCWPIIGALIGGVVLVACITPCILAVCLKKKDGEDIKTKFNLVAEDELVELGIDIYTKHRDKSGDVDKVRVVEGGFTIEGKKYAVVYEKGRNEVKNGEEIPEDHFLAMDKLFKMSHAPSESSEEQSLDSDREKGGHNELSDMIDEYLKQEAKNPGSYHPVERTLDDRGWEISFYDDSLTIDLLFDLVPVGELKKELGLYYSEELVFSDEVIVIKEVSIEEEDPKEYAILYNKKKNKIKEEEDIPRGHIAAMDYLRELQKKEIKFDEYEIEYDEDEKKGDSTKATNELIKLIQNYLSDDRLFDDNYHPKILKGGKFKVSFEKREPQNAKVLDATLKDVSDAQRQVADLTLEVSRKQIEIGRLKESLEKKRSKLGEHKEQILSDNPNVHASDQAKENLEMELRLAESLLSFMKEELGEKSKAIVEASKKEQRLLKILKLEIEQGDNTWEEIYRKVRLLDIKGVVMDTIVESLRLRFPDKQDQISKIAEHPNDLIRSLDALGNEMIFFEPKGHMNLVKKEMAAIFEGTDLMVENMDLQLMVSNLEEKNNLSELEKAGMQFLILSIAPYVSELRYVSSHPEVLEEKGHEANNEEKKQLEEKLLEALSELDRCKELGEEEVLKKVEARSKCEALTKIYKKKFPACQTGNSWQSLVELRDESFIVDKEYLKQISLELAEFILGIEDRGFLGDDMGDQSIYSSYSSSKNLGNAIFKQCNEQKQGIYCDSEQEDGKKHLADVLDSVRVVLTKLNKSHQKRIPGASVSEADGSPVNSVDAVIEVDCY